MRSSLRVGLPACGSGLLRGSCGVSYHVLRLSPRTQSRESEFPAEVVAHVVNGDSGANFTNQRQGISSCQPSKAVTREKTRWRGPRRRHHRFVIDRCWSAESKSEAESMNEVLCSALRRRQNGVILTHAVALLQSRSSNFCAHFLGHYELNYRTKLRSRGGDVHPERKHIAVIAVNGMDPVRLRSRTQARQFFLPEFQRRLEFFLRTHCLTLGVWVGRREQAESLTLR